ncbi:MAG: hypothetical protein GXO89_00655 [Chlorobi bacterium]|nr:hypothetical protein [Chlorobiota bacterium]
MDKESQQYLKNIKFKIFVLGIIIVGCQELHERRIVSAESDFNLIRDFADFQKKMNGLDTIMFWMDLSGCAYHYGERLTVTKSEDSIIIVNEYIEGLDSGSKWINKSRTLVAVNDSIWDFGNFLSRNSNRLSIENKEFGTLVMYYKSDKLPFFTNGLGDKNRFIVDYYKTMFRVDSIYKDYILQELEIIEEKPFKKESF